MRNLRLLVGGLVLTGCVVSVDAVVPASAARYDARLVGRWAEVDGKDRADVTRDSNGYAITYTDGDGKVGHYEAHLGFLGKQLVLDVAPASRKSDTEIQEGAMLIRGHALFVMTIASDSLRLALLQPDSLRAALERGTVRLTYRTDHDQLILMDATMALRSALTAYLLRPGMLDDPSTFRRITP
jgi:hypothetical protein